LEDTSDTDATRMKNSIVLNLNGNTVSLPVQSNIETPMLTLSVQQILTELLEMKAYI
jgi:hypothetical protein